MRHHTAAQKGEGGGWHYVSMNRRGGHPIGYCADHEPHATEQEARECYSRYLRDHLELNRGDWSWSNCEVVEPERCKNPANKAAEIPGYMLGHCMLCPEHMTFEVACKVLGLNKPAGDAWIS